MKLLRVSVLILGVLGGCQSARFSATLPAVREYDALAPRPAPAAEPGSLSASAPIAPEIATSASDVPPAAPSSWSGRLTTPVEASSLVSAAPARRAAVLTRPVAPPDTLRVPRTVQDISQKADPNTTVVNVVGAVVATTGLVMLGASAMADEQQGEYGNLGVIALALRGILLLGLGLALAFFQGKNGRGRRLREARQAAAAPPTPAVLPSQPSVPTPTTAAKPARIVTKSNKIGLVMLTLGGLALVLGVTAIVPVTLLIPAGLVLMTVGLMLYLHK